MLKDQAPRGFQGIGYIGEINTSWWLKVLGLWLFFTRKERVYLISAASFTLLVSARPQWVWTCSVGLPTAPRLQWSSYPAGILLLESQVA